MDDRDIKKETSPNDKAKRRKNYRGKGRKSSSNSARNSNSMDRNRSTNGDSSVPTNDAPNCALNDPSWYTKYPVLIDAASRLQFLSRPGDYLGTGGLGNRLAAGKDIPGIMRIEYQAALGSSKDNSSPASICAKGIYDRIRDAYSGNLSADPPDIFMYMMHLDQFQAYIAWLKRIYGILNYYTPFNHLMPIAMFKAMFPHTNVVTDSDFYVWASKKKDLLSYINQLVYMCNKYVVPSGMAVFDRHRWMNEGIYRDTDSVLSQLYVFCPTGFWMVDTTGASGTTMDLINIGNNGNLITTPEQAFSYGINMYTKLADWGDAKTINGYIMRAFEGEYYPPATLIDETYTIRPVFSPEVLLQIHNINVFSQYIENHWTQDAATGAILVTNSMLNSNLSEPWVDIPADVPDQLSCVIATRLCPVIISNGTDYEMHCGTEIVTAIYMTHRDDRSTSVDQITFYNTSEFNLLNYLTEPSDRKTHLARRLRMITDYAAFTFAPTLNLRYAEIGTGREEANEFTTWIGEMTNSTLVPKETLSYLHLVCQQSEFAIYNPRTV